MRSSEQARGGSSHAGDSGLLAPIVVIPVLALIVNIGVYLLVRQGVTWVIPIEIVAGFAFRLAPLAPILEAAILAFGLWRYCGDSAGRAVGAGVVIFIVRIVTAFVVGYALKIVTSHMSDAQLTSASSAYLSPFISALASGAALLLVLAFYEPAFRSWLAWILALLIWAGGTVLLFWLWRNLVIADSYPWLSYIMRAVGFIVIGHQFQRAMERGGESLMDLFSPLRVGRYTLPNRIVMAPMQRARNDDNRVPTALMAEHYGQRTGVGLQLTEASSVSPLSVGRPGAAAIFRPDQAQGWRRISAAVHAKGGLIFQQLYHLGRKSDPSRMPPGEIPVAPSAIAAKGEIVGINGPMPFATPRALATDEVPAAVDAYRRAAVNARDAGMDGVEIHGANGYLIHQFLNDGANQRTDRYGGGPDARVRFLFDVVDAVVGVFGRDRVGVRLSPHFRVDGSGDSDPATVYGQAASGLEARGIAYVHLIEAVAAGVPQSPPPGTAPIAPVIRRAFRGPLIVNGAYDFASASAVIASGAADLVSFGQLIIANPDLPERFRRGAPFNAPDKATFYVGGAKGYVDYPALEPAEIAAAGED